jgi:prephenate dehydrogenase
LITDGGSTKQSVIDAARAALGSRIGQFVPSHPIAGSEKSGVAAASSELYRGREVILTPLSENLPGDIARIEHWWQQCGARVGIMDPQRHDSALAAISHLPHFIAFAYMESMAARADAAEVLAHAGSGFRDFTRLAASHPQMWTDICTANRPSLLAELQRFEMALQDLRALIEAGDSAAIEQRFAAARATRQRWATSFGVSPAEGE